jgi:hypothetical protein
MSESARSVFYFGVYLLVLGALLILVPNVLLAFGAMPPTGEVWIRLVGMLVLILGTFYMVAGRNNLTAFFRWTLVTRTTAVFFLLGFIFARLASPFILVFWLGDLAGAIWTFLALRREGKLRQG